MPLPTHNPPAHCVFTRSLSADKLPQRKNMTIHIENVKNARKGLSGCAAGSMALCSGSDQPDLIYSWVNCFLKALMRPLRLVFGFFCIKTKVTASAANERGKPSARDSPSDMRSADSPVGFMYFPSQSPLLLPQPNSP